MSPQFINPFPVEYSELKSGLTGEYNVHFEDTLNMNFFEVSSQLVDIPMIDSSTLWKQIMSDIIDEQKDAWNRLAEL
jgi:hypothetical protein